MENKEEIVKHFAELKRNGVDYSEIKKELKSKGYRTDEIANIIRLVDKIVLEDITNSRNSPFIKRLRIVGYILMIVGGILTVGTYYNLLDLKEMYVIVWGLIIGGYLLIFFSRILSKNKK